MNESDLLPLIPLDEVVARVFIKNCCMTGKTLADIKERLEKYSRKKQWYE